MPQQITWRLIKRFTIIGSLFAIAMTAAVMVSAAQDISVTITPTPSAPVVVGTTVSFTASASDPDATTSPPVFTYTLSGAPAGAAIDPSAGTFSWNTTGVTPNTYNFTVNVSDATTLNTGLQNVSIQVVAPTVTLTPIPDQSVTQGSSVNFTASATDNDPSATIAYSLTATPPAGAAIDPAAGTFSWDTTNAATGTYPVSVTATGSTGGSTTQSFNITVTDPAASTNGTGGTATSTGGTIETGDANASTTASNSLNENNVEPDTAGRTNSSTITASSTNDGILGSAASSTAETGANTDNGGTGANTIDTGNAVSTANVINEVNTNIFNSSGLIIFLNQLFGGGIDLNQYDLSYFLDGGPGNSPVTNPNTGNPQCTLLTCLNSSHVNVLDTNDATVTNSVIVRSATGDNTASSTGDATINTGDAYAAANVLNLVNTNIVNSSYLLLSFNNFGDLSQDITLPSAGFFQQLFQHGGTTPNLNSSTYTATNDNIATTTGSVTAEAGTGDNMASTTNEDATTTTTGVGDVTTGTAYSSASSFNQENTNNFGGTSVFMLFRVSGDWTGQIVGLPVGLTATTTPDGIEITSADSADAALALSAYDASSTFNSSSFAVDATNTAAVQNNVDVSAQTGDNAATTDTGTSSVNTGNAYAAASVVNLVNTNIVGQNWIFAVFNIFGNFSGDINFGGGSPLLGVSVAPSNTSPSPGSTVDYVFTVTNTGNADASDVMLNTSFPSGLLTFTSGSQTATGQSWDLGPMLEGQTQTFHMTAQVAGVQPCESISVPLTATVINNAITSPTPSALASSTIAISSPAPASDCVTLPATATPGGGGGGGGGGSGGGGPTWAAPPQLTVTKTVSVSTTTAPTTVNYKVVVQDADSGGPVYDSSLTDTLSDPTGQTMYTRSWELDTINPGDEIDLTYSVDFGTSTKPGLYTNLADVTGRQGSPSNAFVSVGHGTGSVYFLPNGMVLGDSTSSINLATSTLATSTSSVQQNTAPGQCPLLSNFLHAGMKNGSVATLQSFLNQQGSSLPATGFYGPLTTIAVKNFQLTYANDILAPLGLSRPTGSVYSATLQKINQLACGTPLAPVVAASIGAKTAAVQPSHTGSGTSQHGSKTSSKSTLQTTIVPPVITSGGSSTSMPSSWFSSLAHLF